MKTKLMLTLLLSVPMATRAMEAELAQLEAGTAITKNPLADLMQACGAANEEELAKRVRSRVAEVDRHGHDAIIKGLNYLAQKNPDALAKLQAVVAQRRAGTDGAEQPVDQVASLTAAVDILNGINGALASGDAIAQNWNQTSTVGNIEKILELAVLTLAKLEDRAEQTSCWGFCKKQPKAVAAPVAAVAPAPAPQATSGQAK